MLKIYSLLLVCLLLTNCSANRSTVGATLGGATSTSVCVEMGVNDPYAIGACALVGAFKGADIMYKSDYDVHNAVFVDHLNTSPSKQSYTNWYNTKTGNSGIIKTTLRVANGRLTCAEALGHKEFVMTKLYRSA